MARQKISLFVDYINLYGSPNARYSLVGLFINGPVIHPLDILCGKLREFIRFRNFISEDLLEWSLRNSLYTDKIQNPPSWMISQDLALERLYNRDYQVGEGESLRTNFKNMNNYFFNDREQGEKTFGGQSFAVAPLINHLKYVRDDDKSKENIAIVDNLRIWVDKNIFLTKDTREAIGMLTAKKKKNKK